MVKRVEKSILISDLTALDRFAAKLAPHLSAGDVIGLKGELGSGKTTFTQLLAKHLGVTDIVNSPTFTILKSYRGRLPLYHMDVYRLEKTGYDYELDDFIYGRGVSVIEWYPYIEEQLPEEFMAIEFVVTGEKTRILNVKGSGRHAETVRSLGA
jgi:tRNA threonylcarbamoyladenosine biosynthesis protein TsaE